MNAMHSRFGRIADFRVVLANSIQIVKYKIEQYAKQLDQFTTIVPINVAWYLENFLSEGVAPVFGGFPHFLDEEGLLLTFRVAHSWWRKSCPVCNNL